MKPVEFSCSLAGRPTPLPHFWEHTVGSGRAALALRADWRSQLLKCHAELGFEHVRFHGMLDDDMGTLVDEEDSFLYSFFNVDSICDYLLSIGMKPFAELSFMPSALSSGDKTVYSYHANVTPPREGKQWGELIRKLVQHWVDRYGVREVSKWFFEVWNEPNMESFWTGSQSEYFSLYETTAKAIKGVDGQLRVGGPATAKNEWIADFLDFCESSDVPADFVSTHQYPTDAFGTETEDTEAQLAMSSRSILRDNARKTAALTRGRPLYYTEWSSSSNPRDHLHDEPYTAAVIVKTMMEARGLAQGYSFWTFTDIFEENYMPATEFQGGFGLQTLHGIAKPSYRAFELLHKLGSQELVVTGTHETVDAWVALGRDTATVLTTNFALPRSPVRTETISIRLDGLAEPRAATIERIDDGHANAKAHWIEMGKPAAPTQRQVEQLEAASKLRREPVDWKYDLGVLNLQLEVPPEGIAAITVELEPADLNRRQAN